MKIQTPHIIVIGNEKGGAGKTTSSIHLIVSLLHLGFKLCSIDADCRQKSLSRYLENRQNYATKRNINLLHPTHFSLTESNSQDLSTKQSEEQAQFDQLMNNKEHFDFFVIDTPGSNTYLSAYAHSHANTIITPINDSFLDLDVIAHIDLEGYKIVNPSFYSQTIWEQKMLKAKRNQSEINWLVMRNRLSSIDAKNKQRMAETLEKLSKRLGFRVAPGFNERVIYRELFLHGLTLLDIKPGISDITLNMSHLAAKQELNSFLHNLNIPELNDALVELNRIKAHPLEHKLSGEKIQYV